MIYQIEVDLERFLEIENEEVFNDALIYLKEYQKIKRNDIIIYRCLNKEKSFLIKETTLISSTNLRGEYLRRYYFINNSLEERISKYYDSELAKEYGLLIMTLNSNLEKKSKIVKIINLPLIINYINEYLNSLKECELIEDNILNNDFSNVKKDRVKMKLYQKVVNPLLLRIDGMNVDLFSIIFNIPHNLVFKFVHQQAVLTKEDGNYYVKVAKYSSIDSLVGKEAIEYLINNFDIDKEIINETIDLERKNLLIEVKKNDLINKIFLEEIIVPPSSLKRMIDNQKDELERIISYLVKRKNNLEKHDEVPLLIKKIENKYLQRKIIEIFEMFKEENLINFFDFQKYFN